MWLGAMGKPINDEVAAGSSKIGFIISQIEEWLIITYRAYATGSSKIPSVIFEILPENAKGMTLGPYKHIKSAL